LVQAVISAVENFALLLVLAFVLASLLSLAQNYSKLAVQTTIGVLFGLTSVISMSIPVNLADGVIYDAHAILITLSGPFGRVFVPIIVGAITAGYRLYLGGIGNSSWAGIDCVASRIKHVIGAVSSRR
jgi:LytS/YehU family sensor histidine kinase